MPRRNLCSECGVRRRAICCVLSPEQLSALNRVSYRRRYPAGRLISDVECQDWFGNVLSGVIKLTKGLPDGRQQIVDLLFPSDFFGRPFKSTSGYAAETATPVELCCFSRTQFESLLHEWPDLKQTFLERTLDEVDSAREWMLLLGRKSAEEKVAALLLLILQRTAPAVSDDDRLPVRIELPLSRTEMADYLGLRLETVSRQLAHLRRSGVIEIERGRAILVRDVAALERVTEVDPSSHSCRPMPASRCNTSGH